jgi:phosphoglycerate dehydrogenase-like enzyme
MSTATTARPTPVVVAQLDSPFVEGLARRDPTLRIVDLVGLQPDADHVWLTGPRPPASPAAWKELADPVRWVHFGSAGVDGFPLDWLAGRTVSCSRGVNSGAIAEFVVAVILAAEKGLPELWGSGVRPSLHAPSLGSLEGRTVSLIGLGSIGRGVAARLQPFGARVVAFRRSGRTAGADGVSVHPTLDQVLAEADHLVIAAPLTPETRHLLDRAAFARLRPGVHIVNVARGPIVDHDALLAAVDDGTVARATLDVTEPERLPDDHPLRHRRQVLITPHVSWSAPGTVDRSLDLFVANLERWRRGEELAGLVDLSAGY